MDLDVYAVFDLKKGQYAQPFFVPLGTPREHVIINFERAIKTGAGEINFTPEDFELHCIGIFEADKGKFFAEDKADLVVKASTIVDKLKGEKQDGDTIKN